MPSHELSWMPLGVFRVPDDPQGETAFGFDYVDMFESLEFDSFEKGKFLFWLTFNSANDRAIQTNVRVK